MDFLSNKNNSDFLIKKWFFFQTKQERELTNIKSDIWRKMKKKVIRYFLKGGLRNVVGIFSYNKDNIFVQEKILKFLILTLSS